mgnify:CR=1 FL=1
MLWCTHLVAGGIAGLLLSGRTDVETALLSAGIAGVAALVPDVDSPDSWIGRRIPAIPWALKTAVGHRGPLHSLVGALGFSVCLTFLFRRGFDPFLFKMVFGGYVSHLVADSFNPPKVPWLWPLKTRFGVGLVTPRSSFERLVVVPCAVLTFLWLLFPIVVSLLKDIPLFGKLLHG